MRGAALVTAASASWVYWSGLGDPGTRAGLDFDGGTVVRLDAGHAALVVWEDRALVSATSAGPGVRVRRTERDGRRGLQATAAWPTTALLVELVPEDPAIEHWSGWNRSFPALVTAYADTPDGWRHLATFRAKTAAHSSSALRTAELAKLAPFPADLAAHVWLRTDRTWEPAGPGTPPIVDDGGEPAFPGGPALPGNGTEAPARPDRPPPELPPDTTGGKASKSDGTQKPVPLKPFGWAAEADEWGLHEITQCRPLEEKPIKFPPKETWPRPKWCGEGHGPESILPALHLWWELPDPRGAHWIYNTITVEQSAPFTFFMGIGWKGGYFGIQEHASPADRYVLFSVWDGAEPVEVVDVGAGVEAARFGNEGTGVGSHTRWRWREGEAVELAVHADLEDGRTTYSGYVYDRERGVWQLLAKLRGRACGPGSSGLLQSVSSFLEVWTPSEACAHRSARYGPAYHRSASGKWAEAAKVRMTATCGLVPNPDLPNLACPPNQLDGGPDLLALGGGIANHALQAFDGAGEDGGLSAPLHSAKLPELLLLPLPFADGSPGLGHGRRPLLRWGSSRNQLQPFGDAFGERPVCPWYVSDCDGI